MKITYAPTGINNFHNSSPIKLLARSMLACDGGYLIGAGQAARIARHFCGIKGCTCGKGGVRQLDPDAAEFSIPAEYCSC